MSFLRHILRLFVAMLFSALGASMVFAVPLMASGITYFQAETTHFTSAGDVGFAARAPPLTGSNVEVTGGVTVMQGSAFALHGQETAVALFGFEADHIATNRIVPDEFLDQADLDRFANLRNDLGITSNNQLRRNIAVGEGYVDGAHIGEIIGVSGRRGPGVEMPENPIFTTTTVGHPRDLDSEVFVLENLAQRLTPQSTGTIRLLSERTVCASCQGVITQFREMFPNINLIVRSGGQ